MLVPSQPIIGLSTKMSTDVNALLLDYCALSLFLYSTPLKLMFTFASRLMVVGSVHLVIMFIPLFTQLASV